MCETGDTLWSPVGSRTMTIELYSIVLTKCGFCGGLLCTSLFRPIIWTVFKTDVIMSEEQQKKHRQILNSSNL